MGVGTSEQASSHRDGEEGAKLGKPLPLPPYPTHPNAPTRQHGVHLLADGACREERQKHSERCSSCQLACTAWSMPA